jgi:RimJ/RimL family protein N-acetyltransferase
MTVESRPLIGTSIRLEPLERRHADGLLAAANIDPSLYRWSAVPRTSAEADRYIDTALSWHRAGTAEPYATIRIADNTVIGSTRFFNLEQWAWPEGHPRQGRVAPDGAEIGYTWLSGSAVRTGANTEAKLLMLTRAFEDWQVFRVCFHADARNERSRAAIERIGGTFEGILRAHRLAADLTPRDSARYSILAAEWPAIRARLEARLGR